mgnify:CR=1 FL=1
MINDTLYRRKYLIGGIAVVVVLVYIVRLFMLQIIDQSTQTKADNNAQLRQTIYPSRGLIYAQKRLHDHRLDASLVELFLQIFCLCISS